MVDSSWTSVGGGFHVHIPIKRPKAENHIIFLHSACFRYQIASVLGQIFDNINPIIAFLGCSGVIRENIMNFYVL